MEDKLIILNQDGVSLIDGIPHRLTLLISPIGELKISFINLETGTQSSYIHIDAVAALDLYNAQKAFYNGEFYTE